MELPTSDEIHMAKQFLKLNEIDQSEPNLLKVLLIAEIRESNRLARKNEWKPRETPHQGIVEKFDSAPNDIPISGWVPDPPHNPGKAPGDE